MDLAIKDLRELMESKQNGVLHADARYDSFALVGISHEHALTDYYLI
jgi:hypothetical protein